MQWQKIILMVFLLAHAGAGYSSQIPTKEEQLARDETKMENKRVLISGAGIAGLTLAYWLKQYGFVPTLVEKHPALRVGGYKIDIRGAAIEVVRRMGAYDAIFEARTDIQGSTIVDTDGRPLKKMEFALTGHREQGDLEIMRGSLCKALLDRVGDVECIFGDSIKQIVENESGVVVEFEKGQPRPFDLVVGADGLHSVVRQLAFGQESQFLQQLGLYISIFTMPNFLHLDRWEVEYFEPHKIVNVFSARGDVDAKGGFAFALPLSQTPPHSTSEQKKLLEEVFADSGWEVPRLLEAMREATDFYFDAVGQIHMPAWSQDALSC